MKKCISFAIFLLIIITLNANSRFEMLEDFDDNQLDLYSYEASDNSANWELNAGTTYNNSAYSLYLKGGNAKYQLITPLIIDNKTVWSIASRETQIGSMIAFGISDGVNRMLYAFKGNLQNDSLNWNYDYLGAFDSNQWNNYYLDIGKDWFARFDYYPTVNQLIYINYGNGKVYYDEIKNVTEDIIPEPIISFRYFVPTESNNGAYTVNFFSQINNVNTDDTYTYFWQFGDGSVSYEENPQHTYLSTYHSTFKVLLSVKSQNSKWGRSVEFISLDPNECFLPTTINFVGDVMLARQLEAVSNSLIFEETRNILQSADLTVANLEVALTTATIVHPTKPIKFKASPSKVNALVNGGIDIVTLANNHIYDYLYQGILDTQNILNASNILHSGAGIDDYEAFQPLLVNKNGRILAFLASSDRTGSYNNYQPFLQAAYVKPGFAYLKPSNLKSQLDAVADLADFKIVEMHAGSEYSLAPSADYDKSKDAIHELNFDTDESSPKLDIPYLWDIDLRHFAVDQGADLVIVHHSHIIQGFEIYHNKLIAHSLGNFVFDINRGDTKPSMILKTKLGDNGFFEYEVVPVFIDNNTPRLIKNEAALKILNYLSYRSRELNTYFLIDKENFTGKICADTSSIEAIDTITERLINYPSGSDISYPIILKQNGDFAKINSFSPIGDYQYRAGRGLLHFSGFENPDFNQWSSNDAVYDSTHAFTGLRSLKLTDLAPASNVSFSTSYKQRIMSNRPHSFHANIACSNVQYVKLDIAFYSSPGSNTLVGNTTLNLNYTNDSSWHTINEMISIPESCSGFLITLNIKSQNNSNATVYFDNVDIIEWDAWQTDLNCRQLTPNAYYYLQLMKDNDNNSSLVNIVETSYQPIHVNHSTYSYDVTSLNLYNNYPNPFNPSTTIHFSVKNTQNIELSIYNIKGQKVKTLVNSSLDPGHHYVQWLGDNNEHKKVASGVYFYAIKSKDMSVVKKMMLIK